jgi:hypothetical protein
MLNIQILNAKDYSLFQFQRFLFVIAPHCIRLLPGSYMLQMIDPLLGNNHKQTHLHSSESTRNNGGTVGPCRGVKKRTAGAKLTTVQVTKLV